MTIGLLRAAVFFALLVTCSVASAGGLHHGITRKLGIGYGDGYHAREGCPTEKIGGWKHPSASHHTGGYHYPGPRATGAFADQYQGYAPRPSQGEPAFDGPVYSELISDEAQPERAIEHVPTPAKPQMRAKPIVPDDPMIPTRNGHEEARLPSRMFPLAPIR